MINLKNEMSLLFEGKNITFTGDSDNYPTMERNGKAYSAIARFVTFPITPTYHAAIKIRYFDIPEDNEIRIYTCNILFSDKFKMASDEEIKEITQEQKQYIAKTGRAGVHPETFEQLWVSNGIAYPKEFQAGY